MRRREGEEAREGGSGGRVQGGRVGRLATAGLLLVRVRVSVRVRVGVRVIGLGLG